MAAPTDPDLGIVDALVQLSFAVQSVLGAVAAAHDSSIVQLRLLGVLRDREPAMLDLARLLGLEKSSVTGLVDRAQRRGLVERVAGEHDGRAVHVRLTRAGRRLTSRAADEVAGHIAELTAGLPARDRDTLTRLATRLVTDDATRRGLALTETA
jgi:DNA-binding MarR family transcriptional regulator